MLISKSIEHFICFILLILLFSCNTSNNKTHSNEAEIYQRASLFYNNDDYEKSVKCFDSLIFINPLKGEYYFKRGYSKMALVDDKGAIDDFLKAVKYNYDKKAYVYLNIGTLYRSNGMYDSTLYYYDKAIEIDSTYKKAKEEKEEVLKIIRDMKRF
jgi:tetratricopeptide (TPR) repeat protein